MADSWTITLLKSKREQIVVVIQNCERELEKARAGYAHITAALAIFDAGDKPCSQRPKHERGALTPSGGPLYTVSANSLWHQIR